MTAPVTAIYASLLGLFIVILAARVVRGRRKEKVGLGDGDSRTLKKLIRCHANAMEYIPIIIILMFILESNGAESWVLHCFGSITLAARFLHAQGLSKTSGVSFGRFYGILFSWLVIVGLAITNLWVALH